MQQPSGLRPWPMGHCACAPFTRLVRAAAACRRFNHGVLAVLLQVEEGCGLATADDIAAAVHHVLCIIDAEATEQQLLAAAGPQ
jgi:hypothetical protein